MTKKLKVAITGNIGSGKTLFSSFIEEEGFKVIKADDLSKELLVKDEKIREKIIKNFGKDSYRNNLLNKKFLAEKVFSDQKNVLKINSIVHPEVKKHSENLMNRELEKKDIVFVEAALIYEAEMEDLFDFIVLITADEKIRMKRKEELLSKEEFIRRNENQIPEDEKKKAADFVFENTGSQEELEKKAKLLLVLLGKTGNKNF